jgi:hypothetical protein
MTIIYTDNTLDLTTLKRKPEVEKEYQSLLKVIKNAGSTPSEVILNKLEGKKLAKVLNEFPYDLGEGLEHWLVWGVETNIYKMDCTQIYEQFIFSLGENGILVLQEGVVAIFENTPSKKSVGLKHYHLIVRK